MNFRWKLATAAATLLAVFFFASSQLTAQTQGARIVYIDAARVLAAHPAGQQAANLQAQQQTELQPVIDELQALQAKVQSGQQLTAEEQSRGDILLRTVQASRERYAQDIIAASGPAVQAVNDAIMAISRENGYSMVLDGNVAGPQGLNLIVYADESLDVTEQVIERIR